MSQGDNDISTTMNARRKGVLERLSNAVNNLTNLDDSEQRKLNRTIWRTGELSIPQAIPYLERLAKENPNPSLRNYCIAWALGRIGHSEGLPIIELLTTTAKQHVLSNGPISLEITKYTSCTDNELTERQKNLKNYYETYSWADYYLSEIKCIDLAKKYGLANLSNHVKALSVLGICQEAHYWLLPEGERTAYVTLQSEMLPQKIRQSIVGRDVKALIKDIQRELKELTDIACQKDHIKDHPDKTETLFLVGTLYLLSLHDRSVHEALLEVINNLPVSKGYLKAFYTLWKHAEFRCDANMLAHLVHRLETTKTDIPRWGGLSPSSIEYLRRRSWRTLRRLGDLGDARYVDLASSILLSMQDRDGRGIKTEKFSKWSWDTQQNRYDVQEYTKTYDSFSTYLAFGHILYQHSKRLKLSSYKWVIADENATDKRSEAFPELWDRAPEKLLNFLKQSQCAPVHNFAATALKDNKDYLAQIALDDWLLLLQSTYEETALLALLGIRPHYQEKEPDAQLIRACLTAPIKGVRQAGQDWLARAPNILRQDLDLLIWMVVSEDEDIRKLARNYIHIIEGEDLKQKSLLNGLIEKLMQMESETPKEIIENVSWVLQDALQKHLDHISFETIAQLVDHTSQHINLLGVQILTARNLRPHEVPPQLYGKLFNSSSPEVRAQAISMIGNCRDEELANWHDMLGNLLLSDQASVRKEAKRLIVRAVGADSSFSEKILGKVIDALFRTEASEGLHDDLVAVLQNELKGAIPAIDKNQLWRMLTAQSKGTQRAGAGIIQSRPYQDYTVRQWARLGNNPTINVRAWSWRAYEVHQNLIGDHFSDALHLFDSAWEDSRSFAFDYFSKHFPHKNWAPQHVISLFDNKYEDVQRLGHQIVSEQMDGAHGLQYLKALSEHPAIAIQRFVGEFLDTHATGNTDKINELKPYFMSVLGRVNKGRAAKDCILKFLHKEALRDREVAELVSEIMTALSLTATITDKTKALEIMRDITKRFPGMSLPIKTQTPEIRGIRVVENALGSKSAGI